MTMGDAAMVMVSGLVEIAFAESLTCAVKVSVPAAAGVQVIAPVEARDSPAGNAPAEIDHWLPPAPPIAVSGASCGESLRVWRAGDSVGQRRSGDGERDRRDGDGESLGRGGGGGVLDLHRKAARAECGGSARDRAR